MELDLTDASVAELANFYSTTAKHHLRANMVMSQDSHFLDEHGSSRGLSSPLDLKVLLTLRAISDAVLVGANTVRKEDYQTPRLKGEYQDLNKVSPKLVVLSKSLDFDLGSRLFANRDNPPIFITEQNETENWSQNRLRLTSISAVIALPSPLNLHTVVTYLHKTGLFRIVSEGGPEVLEQLITEDLVDELDITISPRIIGYPASKTAVHSAIENWPNRVTAKLGSHRVLRIKR